LLPEYGEAVRSWGFPPGGTAEPRSGEKPAAWKESGKRVKRGLYRTANNFYINADANAAANILRKVKTTLGLNLDGVTRSSLTTLLRVRFWTTQESPSL
jgi:hypothetical protein